MVRREIAIDRIRRDAEAGLAADADVAPVQADEFAYQRQADAGTFVASRLGVHDPVEAGEQVRDLVW
jgi:hypothetical protein